jgi:hypothetical protein
MKPVDDQSKFTSKWRYVEVARYVPNLSRVIRDKINDQPLVIDFSEVDSYSKKHGNIGIYTSVWLYDSKNIDSSTRYSNLYFDLDNKDIEVSYNETEKLLEQLHKNIPVEAVKIYFTGKKGFHIECDSSCLGISPGNDLPTIFRFIASDYKNNMNIDSIDLSVYDARRMWRLAGSMHQDTKLYKTLLTLDDFKKGIEFIKNKASSPSSVDYEETPFNYKANEWYREYSYKMEEDKEKRKDYLAYFNKNGSKGLKKIEDSQKYFTPKELFDKCPSFKRLYKQAKDTGYLEHEARLFLCSILTYTEESIELLHQILSNCHDYNVEKSSAHINDWIRRREIGIGGRPFTCSRANSVGVGCGSCQLEERKKWVKVGDKYMETNEKSSPSPIRFAYKTKKKEE